jgi:hypothetical protein
MYTFFASVEPRTITEFVPAECLCLVSIKSVLTYDTLPFVISDPYPLKTKGLIASTSLSSAPRVTKEHYFFKSSRASPSCPSRENIDEGECAVTIEKQGKAEDLGERPVPLPLCSPLSSHRAVSTSLQLYKRNS